MDFKSVISAVGFSSFTTGFVPCTNNLFDEVRKNPQAVCARLIEHEEWELAEWVMDNFVSLPRAEGHDKPSRH